ncbi:MAG: hypothetical protein KKA65_02950 [Nanoarchaeota archaeon]|nr:hypothetical protein [Nanoarchaeota archaeon]MBU4352194.1 hypothetical protein [Nanoarchaeota archaeon]MBU4456436.1 hypothetical protein [Nanoarchaeota archaeon]MCG2719602.1 hypothetical protein [Nanoarchaeota archaeon]
MQNIIIKFKRIEVIKADLRNHTLHFGIHYDEDEKPMYFKKIYDLRENVDSFVHKLISDIKMKCRKENTMPIDDLDFLNHYTNILIHQKGDGQQIEKIANAVKRFKDKVRNLNSFGRHESYIQKYNEFIGLKANLE